MISCIILSAGFSSRFGSPKSLAKINGETVIEHLQKSLLKTQVGEIIVVLGYEAEKIKPYLLNHTKVRFVYNKDYNLGQTSSFKVGLKAISPEAEGVMLLPVDYPAIKKEMIDKLIKLFLDKKPVLLIPAFGGHKGHPPIFHSKLNKEILALGDAVGLNTIAQGHQKDTVILPVNDSGVVKSFNTLTEFEEIKKLLVL